MFTCKLKSLLQLAGFPDHSFFLWARPISTSKPKPKYISIMKNRSKFYLSASLVGLALNASAATTALWDGDAYNGSWSITGGGGSTDGYGWVNPANPGTGDTVPNGIDDVAQFDNNSYFASGGSLYLTTDTTGSISDSSPVLNVTLGRLELEGASSGRGFELRSPSTGTSSLTFDVSSGNAAIQNTSNGTSDNGISFDVNVILNDDLDVYVQNVHTGTKDSIHFKQLVSDGTGSSAINKSGAGTLRFSGAAGANTFSGGLNITDGLVEGMKNGAFGTGDIHVEQSAIDSTASLEITTGVTDAISDTGLLYLASFGGTNFATITLAADVNETIGGLYFDTLLQAAGTWGATGSGAANINDDWFSGTGVLTVVPEPGTYALLFGMFAFSYIALKRRQR